MPADYRDSLKQTKDFCNNTVLNISHEMTAQRISISEICSKTGLKEQTLRKRFKEPETMRLDEIAVIAKALKVSPFVLSGSKLTYVKEV